MISSGSGLHERPKWVGRDPLKTGAVGPEVRNLSHSSAAQPSPFLLKAQSPVRGQAGRGQGNELQLRCPVVPSG